jgi:hypothetical protein
MFSSLYLFLIVVGSLIIGLALGARLRNRRNKGPHPDL